MKKAVSFKSRKSSFASRIALSSVILGVFCSAQEKPANLVLRVEEISSGPYGGQKGASCLDVYSDGRLIYSHWSTSAMGVQDQSGNISHPEKKETREYKFPERDSWQISEFSDFLQSKEVRRLKSDFAPPHRPIDFFETSTMELFLPKGQSKRIQAREYYVASLIEKSHYPSALILLMDRIEQFENIVTDKGVPTEAPKDCKLEH